MRFVVVGAVVEGDEDDDGNEHQALIELLVAITNSEIPQSTAANSTGHSRIADKGHGE